VRLSQLFALLILATALCPAKDGRYHQNYVALPEREKWQTDEG